MLQLNPGMRLALFAQRHGICVERHPLRIAHALESPGFHGHRAVYNPRSDRPNVANPQNLATGSRAAVRLRTLVGFIESDVNLTGESHPERAAVKTANYRRKRWQQGWTYRVPDVVGGVGCAAASFRASAIISRNFAALSTPLSR